LSEYFHELVDTVSLFSYTLRPQAVLNAPKIVDRSKCIVLMETFIRKWQSITYSAKPKISNTVIYPTLQMKSLGISQDETILSQLLKSATSNDTIHIATSYFNLPVKYQNILWASKAKFEILTSAPEANGFYNSSGISKYVPPAYSYLETKFLNGALRNGKESSLKVNEYCRSGWTWHGKGIWWERGGSLITAVGSSNMNYRSIDRDLELQFYLQTANPSLIRKFQINLGKFYQHAQAVSLRSLESRKSSYVLKLAAEGLKRFL
jgi:CDP-diacylglycerol---glycerol-3-phosphate 3-phosphatidyltransferase